MEIDFERLVPNRPQDTDVEHLELGQGRYPALLVDGFLRDPEHVRSLAMAMRFKRPTSSHPGEVAIASLDAKPLVDFLYDCIGHEYFESPAVMQREAAACQFFRMARRTGEAARSLPERPHADHGLLAGLVYLDPPQSCHGGTSFYRHQPTGADTLFPRELMAGRCPDGRPACSWQPDAATQERMWSRGGRQSFERAKAAGLVGDHDDYRRLMTTAPGETGRPISGSCGSWELTRTIEMKHNRLLVFPAFLLHSAQVDADWLEQTPGASRLTQNWMFNWPGVAR